MARFATVEEFADYTQETIAADDPGAILLLETASAIVQAYTGQTIELVDGDAVVLRGTWEPELELPQRPVTGVASVQIGDEPALAAGSYEWSPDGRLWFPLEGVPSNRSRYGGWGGPSTAIAVTYSHGYAPDAIPDAIRGVVLAVAARKRANPTGATAMRVGSFSEAYGAEQAAEELTKGEQRTLRRWRRRAYSVPLRGRG